MGACRHSPTSRETSPACPRQSWSGCTPSCRTGSYSPTRRSPTSSCGARSGPRRGRASFPDDVGGSMVPPGERPVLDTARVERRIHRESDPDWTSGVPVRAEAIPVTRDGRVIAVIERSTNLTGARPPSRLELTYLAGADDLSRMISEGTFPYPGHDTTLVRSPRVGDGMTRLGAPGRGAHRTPNRQ